MEVLQTELEFFNKIRNELLGQAKDEYALIHGKELIDTFKSKDDAIKKGYASFGNEPFLVKKIVPTDTTLYFTSRLITAKSTG